MKSWFVIHAKPNNDERAARNLSSGNIEVLAPKVRRKVAKSGGITYTTAPLFPGYFFARFDPIHQYHTVKYTRGVNTVVKFNGVIAPLSNDVVEFISSKLVNGVAATGDRRFRKGEKVLIGSGPFKTLSAVFDDELSGEERVAILLNDVTYHARMVIDRGVLETAGG